MGLRGEDVNGRLLGIWKGSGKGADITVKYLHVVQKKDGGEAREFRVMH